jgi:hypothetical protein
VLCSDAGDACSDLASAVQPFRPRSHGGRSRRQHGQPRLDAGEDTRDGAQPRQCDDGMSAASTGHSSRSNTAWLRRR